MKKKEEEKKAYIITLVGDIDVAVRAKNEDEAEDKALNCVLSNLQKRNFFVSEARGFNIDNDKTEIVDEKELEDALKEFDKWEKEAPKNE